MQLKNQPAREGTIVVSIIITVPHPLFGFFKFTDQTLLNFSFEKTGRDLQVTLKAVMHKV